MPSYLDDVVIGFQLRTGHTDRVDTIATRNNGVQGEPFYMEDTEQVWLHHGSGLSNVTWPHLVSTSTTYDVELEDDVILVDVTSGAVTVNLIVASGCPRKKVTIKDWVGNAATHNITIDGNGSDIDGSSTIPINTNYGVETLVSDGINWVVI